MPTFDENYPHLGGDNPVMPEAPAGIYHPASALMPMMLGEERHQLGNSIQSHGLREPIVLLDGLILDGRNRYGYLAGTGKTMDAIRKMKTVDGRPAIIDVNLTDGDAVRFVLDMNLTRRHLSADQKRDLNSTLRQVFGVLAKGAPKQKPDEVNAPNGAFTPLTQQERAQKYNVSRRTVQRWDKLDALEEKAAKAAGREFRRPSDEDRMAEEQAAAPKPKPKPAPAPKPRPKPQPQPAPEATSATFDMAVQQMQAAFRLFDTCWDAAPDAARERVLVDVERFLTAGRNRSCHAA